MRLRSNRVTWLAGLTVFVAFGTLLYAAGLLDYSTHLHGRLKGHGSVIEDSFGNLDSTILPKITGTPHRVPTPVEKPVQEQWDSSRFLKGRPTKMFRGM